jgi:hypothetical protein
MKLVGTLGVALVATMIIAVGSAQAAPRVAEPATEDASAVLDPPNFLDLEAELSTQDDLETISTGSTAGFPADPPLAGTTGPAAPGATGWWIFFARSGSTYTIDSCGSEFQAQLTVYEVGSKTGRTPRPTTVMDTSNDGCADPVTATYNRWWGGAGSPLALRIDDASGTGGDYTVNYSRSIVEPVSEIRKVKLGPIKIPGWRKRLRPNRTDVSIKMFWRSESLRSMKCSLDGGEPTHCLSRPTFEYVKPGKHEVTAVVTEKSGETATDTVAFRIPRDK